MRRAKVGARLAAAVSFAGLAAGSLVFTASTTASAAESSIGVVVWGQTAEQAPILDTFADESGTWTDVYATPGNGALIRNAAGGVEALPVPGSRAAVEQIPAAVAAGPVLDVAFNLSNSIWAVTADGTLFKWGETRGVGVVPNRSWTPAELGSPAVATAGNVTALADGSAVWIDTFDPANPIPVTWDGTPGGEPLAGIEMLDRQNYGLLEDGSVVKVGFEGVTTVLPANAVDPVVDLAMPFAVTQSGVAYRLSATDHELVSNLPEGLEGTPVRVVEAASSSQLALLTDAREVAVWNSQGPSVPAVYLVPESVADGVAKDLVPWDGRTFAVWLGEAATEVVNATTPTVTGTPQVGQTLTAGGGTWDPADATLAYQWLRDGEDIAGASRQTYALVTADEGSKISVRVTASAEGLTSASATSEETSAVEAAPVPDLAVTTEASVSGTAKVGQTLTGSPAVFNDAEAEVVNEWLADGEPIEGATGTSLELTDDHVGAKVSFRSTATRGEETLASTSAETAAVAPAIEPVIFSDIEGIHFQSEIEWLSTQGITTGYDNGNGTFSYAPSAQVLREQMAAFLYRFEHAGANPEPLEGPSEFVDVPATHVFKAHIAWLASTGITTGYDNGNGTKSYAPAAPVLREQMAAFLYRLAGSPEWEGPAVSPFTDLSTSHVFYDEITWLADTEITTGYDNGNGTKSFQGSAPVLREQMAAFLFRFNNLDLED